MSYDKQRHRQAFFIQNRFELGDNVFERRRIDESAHRLLRPHFVRKLFPSAFFTLCFDFFYQPNRPFQHGGQGHDARTVGILCRIDMKQVKQIAAIGGMTNKNYKVMIDDQNYVLRVPGNGTEKMISRVDEIKNAAFAHEIGVDADLIYFNEQTGIKISKFIEDAQTLSPEGAKKPYVMKKICQLLNRLHQCGREMENEFNVYEKIESYEQLLNELKGEYYDDYQSVKQQVLQLKELMDDLEIKLAPCHNDTLAENFIKDKQDQYYLIDWEYAGMNDPMWDVAAHCLENGFNSDEEELFLKTYFKQEPKESYKTRVLINKIYQDFLWSLWTKVKEASGDDFGDYGIERYNRAKENLKLLADKLEG